MVIATELRDDLASPAGETWGPGKLTPSARNRLTVTEECGDFLDVKGVAAPRSTALEELE